MDTGGYGAKMFSKSTRGELNLVEGALEEREGKE